MKVAYAEIISKYKIMVARGEPIIKSMANPDNTWVVKSGDIFKINKGEVVLVLEGVVAINICQESFMEHNRCITTHEEPFRVGKGIRGMLLGLVESYGPPLPLQYIAKRNVKIVKISSEDFERAFMREGHFRYFVEIISFILAMLLDSHYERAFSNRYNAIRSMIYRYQVQQEEGVLHDDSLSGFILKRTKISRSYLFQVLADLKSGGYIEVSNGKLISIIKELPEEY
ncbi:TPA: hypothetical protein I8Y09_000962 [Raoultella ornithinolytica]|nr:hypothetical protein [Raoultella ornithinolytica]